MHDSQSVETILARLMPPALSVSAQQEIETMLDELAGPAPAEQTPTRPSWRWYFGGGLAAALATGLLIPQLLEPAAPQATTAATAPEVLLVGETDRVESMTDEGWREIGDGSAVRAMRVRIIEESKLLDEETGIVMQVSQPREELLLMPISAF
jgi:hypothetical protein